MINHPSVWLNSGGFHLYTPLHYAAETGCLPLLRLLLSNNFVQINLPDIKGRRPLHLLLHSSFKKQFLNAFCIDFDFMKGVIESNISIVNEKLDTNYLECLDLILKDPRTDINAIDNEGNRPIHLAFFSGNISIIKKVLEHRNVDINQLNIQGQSPLSLVIKEKNESLFFFLIEANLPFTIDEKLLDIPTTPAIANYLNSLLGLN